MENGNLSEKDRMLLALTVERQAITALAGRLAKRGEEALEAARTKNSRHLLMIGAALTAAGWTVLAASNALYEAGLAVDKTASQPLCNHNQTSPAP